MNASVLQSDATDLLGARPALGQASHAVHLTGVRVRVPWRAVLQSDLGPVLQEALVILDALLAHRPYIRK